MVAPAATVTVGGAGRITGSLPERDMTAPPEGAALLRVTVPVTGLPPTTLTGLSEIESVDAVAAVTVIVDDLLVPLKVAVIVAVPGDNAVTVNEALEDAA